MRDFQSIGVPPVLASEPFAITDDSGAYVFRDLPAGDFYIREEVTGGLRQTYPADHLLASSFEQRQIFELDFATGVGNRFRPLALQANDLVAGIAVSPVDDRVYAVADSGQVYLVESLRGKTVALGSLIVVPGVPPISPGEGDFDFDPTSFNPATGDTTVDIYVVVGIDSGQRNQLYRAELDYASCTGGDTLVCRPTLGPAQFIGRIDANDLSGLAFDDAGNLYAYDTRGGVEFNTFGRLWQIDKTTGALISVIDVPIGQSGGSFAGIDFDPQSGLLHGVHSSSRQRTFFTFDPATQAVTSIFQAADPQVAGLEFVQTDAHYVLLDDGESVRRVDFGNQRQAGEIHGTKWLDLNGDGQQTRNEPGLEGWTIYLDLNNNGQQDADEPAQVTNARGDYWFMDLQPGSYTVDEVVQEGWTQTFPGKPHVVFVERGATLEGVNFGNVPLGQIHGRKWLDADADLEPGPNEPGLAGWQIYLDVNGNHQFDEGEPVTTTDERGNYWFMDLPPGEYTVGEVIQDGWVQTFPSPQGLTDLFPFEDVDAEATFSVGDSFSTLAVAGAHATVTVSPFTWSDGTVTSSGDARVLLVGAEVSPTHVLAPNNANLQFDFGETLTSLTVVFSDMGGNVNLLVNGQLQNVENLSSLNGQSVAGVFVAVNQLTDTLGVLSLSGTIDSFAIGGQEFWIDNLLITGQPVSGTGVHVVQLGPGQIEENRDFGNYPLKGEIHGTKFSDFDGDGVRGRNDRGILGWTIYLDLNNNGQLDEGEPTTQTERTGEYWFMGLEAGTYVVREVPQEGWTQTAPAVTFGRDSYAGGEQPLAVRTGDVTGDGAADVVLADFGGSSLLIYENLGDGTLADPRTIALKGRPIEFDLVDLNGDGALDVAILLSDVSQLVTYLNDGAGGFVGEADYSVPVNPTSLSVADVNDDGWADVLVAGSTDQVLSLWLNQGDGSLLESMKLDVGTVPIDTALVDFNHDGRMDAAVLSRQDGVVRLLLQPDDGAPWDVTYELPVLPQAARMAIADFDGDGNYDIAVTSTVNGAAVYYGSGSVTHLAFNEDNVVLPVPAELLGIAAGDVNGDELPDLVIPDPAADELLIFLASPDGGFLPALQEAVGNRPIDVVLADVNGDGRMDIATADSPGATVLLQGPSGYYIVPLEAGDVVTGRDFGNFRNGQITGTKIHDQNCNGVLGDGDQPETGLGGFTIYVDLDDDGVLDPGEPFAVTADDGTYAIDNVGPGTYSVREVVMDPYAQSYPQTGRHIVTISQTNQSVSGIDFGNFIHTPLPDGSDYLYAFGGNDELWGDNTVTDPCILSLGDDDHLFDHAGDDFMAGQLRNDTYHFGPSLVPGEVDTVEELEDGGTNERWDEGIYDRLNFDGVPEKKFDGLDTSEPVVVDLSGSGATYAQPTIAEYANAGTRAIQTNANEQFAFIEQIVGGAADDTLIGNSRDNLLDGRSGSDILVGAAGDDTYVFTPGEPANNDQLVETIGSDTLDFSAIPGPVTVDLSAPVVIATYAPAQQVTTPSPGLFENVIGTVAADSLQGSGEDNRIEGSDAADTLIGLAGDDELIGGRDNDTYIFADGWGSDVVTELANQGDDDFMDFSLVTAPLAFVVGQTIQVTDGTNAVLHDGLHVERLLGGSSLSDTLTSGDGDNLWLINAPNTGTLNGVAFSGIENLIGGSGNDTFQFLPGGSLTGGIDGGAGDDTFDFSQAGSVGGVVDGNLGSDSLLGDNTDRTWTVDGPESGNASGIGNFAGIENLVGGGGTDTFAVTSGGTLMNGSLDGREGNDTLLADNVTTTFTLDGDNAGTHVGTSSFSFSRNRESDGR